MDENQKKCLQQSEAKEEKSTSRREAIKRIAYSIGLLAVQPLIFKHSDAAFVGSRSDGDYCSQFYSSYSSYSDYSDYSDYSSYSSYSSYYWPNSGGRR